MIKLSVVTRDNMEKEVINAIFEQNESEQPITGKKMDEIISTVIKWDDEILVRVYNQLMSDKMKGIKI